MKTLEFKKKKTSEPIAINTVEFEKYTGCGKEEIIINGIMTHILTQMVIDRDKFRSRLEYAISQIIDGQILVEVAVDGEKIINASKEGDNYIFVAYEISPEIK